MVEQDITLPPGPGLHARPAAMFVALAKQFEAKIEIARDGRTADGKSIIGLMSLGATGGSTVSIRCTGDDAAAALAALTALIAADFPQA